MKVLFGILLCLVLINIQPGFSDIYSNNTNQRVTSPENSLPQNTLTVSTDKSHYTDKDMIVVSGLVGYPIPGFPVIIRIQTPNGNLLSTQQVMVSSDGTYSKFIYAGGNSWLQEGTYTIFAQYGVKNISAQTTFDFKKSITPVTQQPQTTGQPQTYQQPTTAGQPSTYQQPQTSPSQIIQQSNPEPQMKIDLSGNNLFVIVGAIIAAIAGIAIYFVSSSSGKRSKREDMLQDKREEMMRVEREDMLLDEKTTTERAEKEAMLRAEIEASERGENESIQQNDKALEIKDEEQYENTNDIDIPIPYISEDLETTITINYGQRMKTKNRIFVSKKQSTKPNSSPLEQDRAQFKSEQIKGKDVTGYVGENWVRFKIGIKKFRTSHARFVYGGNKEIGTDDSPGYTLMVTFANNEKVFKNLVIQALQENGFGCLVGNTSASCHRIEDYPTDEKARQVLKSICKSVNSKIYL